MSNRVNLTLDIMKASIKNPLITVRQGEGNFETLRATVTANGEPLDLQGWTITFMGTTAGKHKIVDGNVTLIDASNGIFEYTPSKAWGMDVGGFKIAYFKFISGDGSTSSANFQVEVIEAVDLTKEDAQNYISVVDTTIAEINQHLTDSLANVTQSIAETSSAASSLSVNVSNIASSAVNQINDTASSAVYNVDSVASNVVNNVNSTASSAVDNVNNTASNAVNEVNVTASNATNSITSSVTALGNRVDDYNNKLAAVKVGGRNLVLGTSERVVQANNWNMEVANIKYDKVLGNQLYASVLINNADHAIDLRQGSSYVMLENIDRSGNILKSITGNAVSYNANGVSQCSISMDDNTVSVRVRIKTNNMSANTYYSRLKVERGNIPTDWTPAPEDVPSNDTQLVHKNGTETIAGDKTFTGKFTSSQPIDGALSTRNAAFTDFNDVARNMVKYSGSWVVASQSIANSPLQNYYTAIITPGFTGGTDGYIELVPFAGGLSKKYIAVVGSGTLSAWKSFAFDDDVAHKTGNETISGDKTFTGKVTFSGSFDTQTVTNNGVTMTFKKFGNIVTVIGSGSYTGGDVNAFAKISDGVVPSGYLPAGMALVNANWGANVGQMGFDSSGAWLHRGPSVLSKSWVVITGSWSV